MRPISSIAASSHCGPRRLSGSSPEKNTHIAPVWPFQPSPRRHPARARVAAAGREYTAFAFDVDIVKVGRGWGDEVNALYASAHRGMHRRRHRVRFTGAATAEKQPAP